ncbi:hypothetical protein GCM10025780_24120 [Frondihabitans cladoniiphilus]|uniref:Uncharacterized protein n=1 Tax=Frondihabitans cladoniiphilus TaxID=715785 RepID=A0ABP8W1R0_9MICO
MVGKLEDADGLPCDPTAYLDNDAEKLVATNVGMWELTETVCHGASFLLCPQRY